MKNVSKEISGLGNRLGLIRTEKEFSQSDIARAIGMSRPNYTAIENQISGRFLKDYQLKILADKLDVSTDYLLGRIQDPHPSAELISIMQSLQVSSDTIHKIQEIHKQSLLFYNFDTFENFMNYFEINFWEVIGLYKKANSFYKSEYKFILDFTKDIYPPIVNFISPHTFLDNSAFEYKYFYVDRDIVNHLYETHNEIFSDTSLSLKDKWDKLGKLVDEDKFSEKYIFCYSEKKKKQEFINALNEVRRILNDFSYIMDFDDAGLIFSFYDKQDEIFKYIDEILEIITDSPTESIDRIVENLWSSLNFFTRTVLSSLNFVKYRINDYLNKYLEDEIYS